MKHLVNSLQFEIACSDEGQAFGLRQHFASVAQEQITEIVDKICSRYTANGETYRINKLEIDLGVFTGSSLEMRFGEAFDSKFEQELLNQIAAIASTQGIQENTYTSFDTLVYFLRQGVLPWWAGNEITMEEVLFATLHNKEQLRIFLNENITNTILFRRISYLPGNDVKARFISLLSALQEAQEWILLLLVELKGALSGLTDVTADKIESTVARVILQQVIQVVKVHPSRTAIWEAAGMTICKELPVDDTLRLTIYRAAGNTLSRQQSGAPSAVDNGADIAVASNQQTSLIQNNENLAFKPVENTRNREADAVPAENESSEKYAINSAGIVLIAPYFKPLFTKLDYLDKNEWKNENCLFKAIQILKFISSGRKESPEYDLAFEKILCGLQVAHPIQTDVEITEAEYAEAEDLLRSVIHNWPALKNTSITGLREAFLMREGIVINKNQEWLLHVERKTLDVLLEQLPWGFSTIRLPWCPWMISVDW